MVTVNYHGVEFDCHVAYDSGGPGIRADFYVDGIDVDRIEDQSEWEAFSALTPLEWLASCDTSDLESMAIAQEKDDGAEALADADMDYRRIGFD